MARWGPTAPEAVPSACIQLGQTARAESCFSATVKRRFGLSSVPPLLGYSPEASGTATTGEMRPRKVGHWPLWRCQRFQRHARAICSHEWTPPGPVRIHPAELRSPPTSLPPEKSCTPGRVWAGSALQPKSILTSSQILPSKSISSYAGGFGSHLQHADRTDNVPRVSVVRDERRCRRATIAS